MEGIGEKALVYGLLLKSVVSSFFCVFGADCNYTDNLKKPIYGMKFGKKRGYSLVAGRKTNGFVDCASFNKRYLLVRFINLFRLCKKYISRFYVSFRLEPMIEPTIVSNYGKSAIDIREHFIQVTIPFAFTPTWALSARSKNASVTLSLGQKTLLSAIKDNPYARSEELSKSIGMSLSSVKKNLVKLWKLGLIERAGNNRSGYWKVKD